MIASSGFLRVLFIPIVFLAHSTDSFAQSPINDADLREDADQIPKEAISDPEVISILERLRILKANQSKLGPKHPSFATIQKQVSETAARLNVLLGRYRHDSEPEIRNDFQKESGSVSSTDMVRVDDGEKSRFTKRLDPMAQLQQSAIQSRQSNWGYWGSNPGTYTNSKEHTNRLVPIYTFGGNLSRYKGPASIYRDSEKLRQLYGRIPDNTLNLNAEYIDLTDLYHLQRRAIEVDGKKYVFLVIFDGLDYFSLLASAVYKSGEVSYSQGSGKGLVFQDYEGCERDYGFAVTSPYCREIEADVNAQLLLGVPTRFGGYDSRYGGGAPWDGAVDIDYLLGRSRQVEHAVTDSAASACSMVTGRKLVNATINISPDGNELETVARWAQREKGFALGVVTTVPFCHATPAAAYAVNVSRNDYQDLARDMLGLPSISHRSQPLPGMDVVIGGGALDESSAQTSQGFNYVPGNPYICESDLERIASENYVITRRQRGKNGTELLRNAVIEAIQGEKRLFGLFGVKFGHLPFQTADGDYAPVSGSQSIEDINENPSLSDFTDAAIRKLQIDSDGFWLMVEAGDVDLAAHDNDIDRLVGGVLQGERAVKSIFDWVEANNAWEQSLVIIASDHGHAFHLKDPNPIAEAGRPGHK
jgi:alkaline phosphatase